MTTPDLELVHPDGCWMDPRPHEHRITFLESPVAAPPRPAVGLPRPLRDVGGRASAPPPPLVRRAAHK